MIYLNNRETSPLVQRFSVYWKLSENTREILLTYLTHTNQKGAAFHIGEFKTCDPPEMTTAIEKQKIQLNFWGLDLTPKSSGRTEG